MGFGYWMDQRPTTVEEVAMFKRQHFHASKAWRKKCPKEQQQAGDSTSAIVEYVSHYFNVFRPTGKMMVCKSTT